MKNKTRDYYLIWTSYDEGNWFDNLEVKTQKIKIKKKDKKKK